MNFNKIMRNTAISAVVFAGVIALSSCQIPGIGNTPDAGDGNVHTHELTFVSGMDATCTAEGIEDYYECAGCNKLFADENAETEIATPQKISKTDHNEVVIPAKPSTCTQDGSTEGKKCGTCGRILQAPEKIAHTGFVLNGEHICHATLNDHGVEGLTVTFENGEYTLIGDGAIISDIGADNITINIGGGITITSEGDAISALNAKVNFIGGETTVNGNINFSDSFLRIDNNSVLNVNGIVSVKGYLTASDDGEYQNANHRLFVRQGTLNIYNATVGQAAITTNSIQVGSQRDDVEGYLNITSAGNGVQIVVNAEGRYVFANGEVNIIGIETDGVKPASALRFEGGSGPRYLDILEDVKFTVKNYQELMWNGWKNVYAGICRESINMENVDYVLNTTSSSTNAIYIYAHVVVVAEYTDADGNTGLANLKIDGYVAKYSKNSTVESFDDINWIGADDILNEGVNVTFIGWVE